MLLLPILYRFKQLNLDGGIRVVKGIKRLNRKIIIVTVILGLMLTSTVAVVAEPSSLGLSNGLKHRLDTALKKVNELTIEIDVLRGIVGKLQNKNTELEQANSKLSLENNTLLNDISRLNEKNKSLAVENQSLIEANNRLLEENHKLTTDNNRLLEENHGLKEQVELLQQQVKPTAYDGYHKMGLWEFEGYKTVVGSPDRWGRVTTYSYALFSKDRQEIYIPADSKPFTAGFYYLAGIPGNSSGVFEVQTIEKDFLNREFLKEWSSYPVSGETLVKLQSLPLE